MDDWLSDPELAGFIRTYPGSLFAVRAGGEEQVLAVCGCGAIGSPGMIGWTGERCGPCADAQFEGRTVPPPVVVYGLADTPAAVRFAPDGSQLVTAGQHNKLVCVNRGSGERIESAAYSAQNIDHLIGLTFRPDGRAVIAAEASNHLSHWNLVTNQVVRSGGASALFPFTPSPDGRYAIRSRDRVWEEIVWDRPHDPLRRAAYFSSMRSGGFGHTGAKWVGLFHTGLWQVDPNGWTWSMLRSDVFAGLDPGEIDPEFFFEHLRVFAIDPDHDLVAVGVDDPEDYGVQNGPAYLGGIRTDRGWQPLPTPEEFEGQTPAVHGFTPDGQWVLYDFNDGPLRFFPTAPGREPVTIRALAEQPLQPGTVAFSPDGNTLACHCPDGGLLWMLPWRRLLSP